MSLTYEEPAPATEPQRPALSPAIATIALVAVNVVLFLMEGAWGGSGNWKTLVRMGANVGREGLVTEPWRVLSSAFLHGSTAHVAMNMYALFVLGTFLERVLGRARFLVIYAVSALVGGLLSAVAHEAEIGVGASGAVWGLMISQIVLLARLRRDVQVSWGQLTQPLVINLAISFIPGIDLAAHLGGGIAGGLLTLLVPRRPVGTDDRAWRPWAAIGVVLMFASVVTALLMGRPWEH